MITYKTSELVPKSVYITAIVLTALLFGLVHLLATAQVFGEQTFSYM